MRTALNAKQRRRLRARAKVRADRQGTPYCPTCQAPEQCALHRACVKTGNALERVSEPRAPQ